MTLIEAGYFETPGEGVPLQKHLDVAYKDFRAFIKARKIPCSQTPFQEKMALWWQ